MSTHDRTAIAGAVAWAGYLLVLPFHRVWSLPWFGEKLQPPEIAFLGLAAVAIGTVWHRRALPRFFIADTAPLAWLGASLVALVWSPLALNRAAVIEVLGSAYLVSLYFAVRITATPELLGRYGQWFSSATAAAAVLGITGVVASMSGLDTRLATPAITPVPYLGPAPRAQALTTGPQMLASVLLVAIPLFIAARLDRRWRRIDTFVTLLLAAGLGATFSKTALCLIPSLVVMWAVGGGAATAGREQGRRRRLGLAAGVTAAVALLFAVASHVMVMRQSAVPAMTASQLVAGRPMESFSWKGETWAIMPTTYVFNKLASLQAIERLWPAGVGPAGQPRYVETLKTEGKYPRSIWLTDPHSTYLGTAAELGAPGAIALVLLVAAGLVTIRRLLAEPAARSWETAAYAGIGVAFLIEAISTDLMNCRHYWFLLGVMVSRLPTSRPLVIRRSDR